MAGEMKALQIQADQVPEKMAASWNKFVADRRDKAWELEEEVARDLGKVRMDKAKVVDQTLIDQEVEENDRMQEMKRMEVRWVSHTS